MDQPVVRMRSCGGRKLIRPPPFTMRMLRLAPSAIRDPGPHADTNAPGHPKSFVGARTLRVQGSPVQSRRWKECGLLVLLSTIGFEREVRPDPGTWPPFRRVRRRPPAAASPGAYSSRWLKAPVAQASSARSCRNNSLGQFGAVEHPPVSSCARGQKTFALNGLLD